jgi:hypothetical protein
MPGGARARRSTGDPTATAAAAVVRAPAPRPARRAGRPGGASGPGTAA